MQTLKRWLLRMAASERGQDMVEYAMIIVVISVPVVLAGIALSPAFAAWAEQVAATIPSVGG